jgi:lipoprotein-anchoring transpeptidase ErfK/SrfK
MLRAVHRAWILAALLAGAVLAAGLLTARAGAGSAEATAPRPVVHHPAPRPAAPPWRHPLVAVLGDHVVHAAPRGDARRIARIRARRPLTHVRTVLPVTGRKPGWVHVRLPGRPNGHQGWISADRTRHLATEWRIAVGLAHRRVTVYRRGKVQARFRAVVGQATAPTPVGHFFVEESVRVPSAGGPYALALSARSTVYKEFDGGPGQVALHGVTGLQGALGTAVSHGCLRLSARAMTWLARRIGAGVPISVER